MMLSLSLKADTAASVSVWYEILPFALAILYIVISPLLTKLVKIIILAQINADDKKHGASAASSPSHSSDSIGEYIEYAVDAVQIFPLTLLPIIGSLLAVLSDKNFFANMVMLVLFVVLAVALNAWVLTRSTPDYLAAKWMGLTVVSSIAILSNFFGIFVVIIL